MSLTKYKQKRNFEVTSEPKGRVKSSKSKLIFVVQRHKASRLHYDFRLELNGVLKSWAVPKGPSMNPRDKRLAMMVEDHPYDYKDFEGIIPEGNYGAGIVEIWDQGTYADIENSSKKKAEERLVQGLKKGDLKFRLFGKKLKGEFVLVNLKKDDNSWLLIKHRDEYAVDRDYNSEALTPKGSPINKALSQKKAARERPTGTVTRKATKKEEGQKVFTFGKLKVAITHPGKIYFPEEDITKGDVADYYQVMSSYILPYLKNRPESLLRHPNGIREESFFQKDAGGSAPSFVNSKPLYSESVNKDIDYILCNNAATLAYMNNLGCIEINPWHSTVQKPDHPDYFMIDIDPSKKNTFDEVVEVAQAVKVVMDKAGGECYCKTSGATGMHVYIPAGKKYTYDQVKDFANLICMLVNDMLPEFTTLERNLKKRGNKKIYLDYLQNRRGQTLACVYSLRPRPGAAVSAPLAWEEVKKGISPQQFNIFNIQKRVEQKGDLFAGILKRGIDMEKCIDKLKA